MSDEPDDALVQYVGAAAELTRMPLRPDRRRAVAIAMTRIADFAAHLESFALADDVEIAGVFTP